MGPNHFRIILAYLRSVDAVSRRRILYHGTSLSVGKRILSEGLVPEPKKRSWSEDPGVGYHTLPRVSLPGTYLTGNLMTAYSSATRTAGPHAEHVLVIVDVEESSLVHDEDTLKGPLQLVLQDFLPEGHVLTEYGVLQIYDDMMKGEIDDKIHESAKKFLKSIDVQAFEGRGRQDERMQVVEKALKALITRQASYALPTITWYADEKNWEQMKAAQSERFDLSDLPQPKDSDKIFMSALEEMSSKLKPVHARGMAADRFMATSRIKEPIGFSGSNKIVAIVGINNDWEGSGPATFKFYYGNPSDTRLDGFFKEYKERIGGEYAVIDKSGKTVLESLKSNKTAPVLEEDPVV